MASLAVIGEGLVELELDVGAERLLHAPGGDAANIAFGDDDLVTTA